MKPANIVLDLLRTYKGRGTSAKNIMATAEMFGINQNLARVTVSRLVARGIVEKVARGQYRLADVSDPVSDFVEEWRLGESRQRPWIESTYVLAHSMTRSPRHLWVLEATGFKRLKDHLWARPDNLQRSSGSLEKWLMDLGLDQNTMIIHGGRINQPLETTLKQNYHPQGLIEGYALMSAKLDSSAAVLATQTQAEAMATSFQLGGEAIQLLAKDPYLPQALMPVNEREQLWKTVIRYDQLGRNIWQESPTSMPAAVASYR